MKRIENIEDTNTKYYKNLNFTPLSHIEDNVMIFEGDKAVKKLLKSDSEIISLFICNEMLNNYTEFIENSRINTDHTYIADKTLMNEIVGFKLHSHALAIAKIPKNIEIENMPKRIVAMNGIVNSENVGAIVRNAAAFNTFGLISDKKTSSPFLRRAVRVSMGNIVDMKVRKNVDLIDEIQKLKSMGYFIIAAEICDNSMAIDMIASADKFCLIFGSEGKGIEVSILDLCDQIVHIPINSSVNSINVAASSAILLHKLSSIHEIKSNNQMDET